MQVRKCPALFISASASNQGKTTITAGLALYHRRCGRKVRVFKTGPDFLDPMVLAKASGNPVYQLDLWMVGEKECRRLLYEAAQEADIILVEGVMGLFDGKPSSADLAQLFDIPVVAVINASSMAQTFHAVAYGLHRFRENLSFAGTLANGVSSARHAALLLDDTKYDIKYLGCLPRDEHFALPARHLGLVQAGEIDDIEKRLEFVSAAIAGTRLAELLPVVNFLPVESDKPPQCLAGKAIAVARDLAFSFLYEANLNLLQAMGAKLRFFSPLVDAEIPAADSVYLPGGYPELYIDQLAANVSMKMSLRDHFEKGKAMYAECGGMLYLLESLADREGKQSDMVGLLPGQASMQSKLNALSFQSVVLPEGLLRGHTFHHSRTTVRMAATTFGMRQYDGNQGEAIYCLNNLWASYLHLYFPSCPAAAAQFFK